MIRGVSSRLFCSNAWRQPQTWFSIARRAHRGIADKALDFDKYNPEGKKGMQWVSDRLAQRQVIGNAVFALLATSGCAATYWAFTDPEKGNFTPDVDFSNWRVYEPEDEDEVVRLMQKAIGEGWQLRVVGSGISPNGLGFASKCMISMAQMDKVLHVDTEKKQVRVQAGARVQDVVEALRPHGLTLQNYASVREQQVGGFTQVSAHGTGAALPPVDEQLVSLRVVSPGSGNAVTMEKRRDATFDWVKVGLGAMGVVTEVTLQCVDAHKLIEKTFVATRDEVRRSHKRWLKQHKHMRYMWIPYTDAVVVVQCNDTRMNKPISPGWLAKTYTAEERLQPFVDLLSSARKDVPGLQDDPSALVERTPMQLRGDLIQLDPLNSQWIRQVNEAEAEHWRRSRGYRIDWSDQVLGFDCGGQQWVLEVAFPTGGTVNEPGNKDLEYMSDLMALLEQNDVAAPAPIEQRWSSSSAAPMSPAHSSNPSDVHSWVGVIMYLPTNDVATRATIGAAFKRYAELCEEELMPKYGAVWHWAKLEPGGDPERLSRTRARLRERYDVRRFNFVRHALDPENNLGNKWLNSLLPLTRD